MRRFMLISLAASVSALVTLNAGPAHNNQDKQLSISQLGPEPYLVLPDSLETVVKHSSAAVIAQIVGLGDLKLVEVSVPFSSRLSIQGYATYRAIIHDVLFHRQPESTPPLIVGAEVEFTLRVSRESAEAFVAKRVPVVAGDECLLFVIPERQGWGILDWHMQFRRSKQLSGTAEYLGDSRAFKLGPKWFGGLVPVTSAGEVIIPNWDGLVGEIRRLGKQPIAK